MQTETAYIYFCLLLQNNPLLAQLQPYFNFFYSSSLEIRTMMYKCISCKCVCLPIDLLHPDIFRVLVSLWPLFGAIKQELDSADSSEGYGWAYTELDSGVAIHLPG